MPLSDPDSETNSALLGRPSTERRRIGAIDIGSNSVRIAVVEVQGDVLQVVEEASATPRLIRDVEVDGAFSRETIDRVLAILADFRAIADAARADAIVAVATSAARDATNGDTLIARAAGGELQWDVVLQGAGETVFFDC